MYKDVFGQFLSDGIGVCFRPCIKVDDKGIDMPVFFNPSNNPAQFFAFDQYRSLLVGRLELRIVFNNQHFFEAFLHAGPDGMLLEIKSFDFSIIEFRVSKLLKLEIVLGNSWIWFI